MCVLSIDWDFGYAASTLERCVIWCYTLQNSIVSNWPREHLTVPNTVESDHLLAFRISGPRKQWRVLDGNDEALSPSRPSITVYTHIGFWTDNGLDQGDTSTNFWRQEGQKNNGQEVEADSRYVCTWYFNDETYKEYPYMIAVSQRGAGRGERQTPKGRGGQSEETEEGRWYPRIPWGWVLLLPSWSFRFVSFTISTELPIGGPDTYTYQSSSRFRKPLKDIYTVCRKVAGWDRVFFWTVL